MKNKLIVRKIHCSGSSDIKNAEELLDRYTEEHTIEQVNWPDFPYKPLVKFKIAYCDKQIWLKFMVKEESVRAQQSQINSDVYKDSCVEFFISPDNSETYYNFEFNCIGIPYVAHGLPGPNRTLVNPEIVRRIQTKSSLGDVPFEERTGGQSWELMIVIPKECFVADSKIVFEGLSASGNFYKCGDETSIPHFITWSPIKTETPNYHQPKFFGELQFED